MARLEGEVEGGPRGDFGEGGQDSLGLGAEDALDVDRVRLRHEELEQARPPVVRSDRIPVHELPLGQREQHGLGLDPSALRRV